MSTGLVVIVILRYPAQALTHSYLGINFGPTRLTTYYLLTFVSLYDLFPAILFTRLNPPLRVHNRKCGCSSVGVERLSAQHSPARLVLFTTPWKPHPQVATRNTCFNIRFGSLVCSRTIPTLYLSASRHGHQRDSLSDIASRHNYSNRQWDHA